MKLLFAWIGWADLEAAKHDGEGPILGALRTRQFDATWLLSSWRNEEVALYLGWLKTKAPQVRLHNRSTNLSSPNAFTEIYQHVTVVLEEALESTPKAPQLTFHLSPGTPIMASVWLLLATSRFPAELVESSTGQLNTVEKPFNLPRQILPDLLHAPDDRLRQSIIESPSAASNFGEIAFQSPPMLRVVNFAKKAAPRNVPLLIEGESGTGKELFARAVHKASPRADKPMVVVNCGAIPSNLVESRLFGHKKGAFTGAMKDQLGCFDEADGGTLFLDEIGELPLPAQVALLRVLQEGEVVPVGANKARKVDVRVIAATNRDLFLETRAMRFREDLFYRIAVLHIRLPALRERGNDLDLLIENGMLKINKEMAEDPLYKPKELDASARKVLMAQTWRGNVRELHNTMRRALVWSDNVIVTAEDIEAALFPEPSSQSGDPILNRSLGEGCSLDSILGEVSTHYISRALTAAKGNKTRAAKLIGFASYQRLDLHRQKNGV